MKFVGWNWRLTCSYWQEVTAVWWREYEAFRKQTSWSRTAFFQEDSGVFIFQKGLKVIEELSRPPLGSIVASSSQGKPLQKLQGVREISLVLQPQLQLLFLHPLRSVGSICSLLRCPQGLCPCPGLGIRRPPTPLPSLQACRSLPLTHSFIHSFVPPHKSRLVWEVGITPGLAEFSGSGGEVQFTECYPVTPTAPSSAHLKMHYSAVTS